MDILLVMGLGILVGAKLFPSRYKKQNERLQTLCTLLLIFSMGVLLGRRENFLQELSSLGLQSFVFFLVPTVLSTALVYVLTQNFLVKPTKEEEKP